MEFPGQNFTAQIGGTVLLEGILHAVRVIETLQCSLAAGAGLTEVDGIAGVAFHFEGASLHGADNQPASRRTFAAGGGVKGALSVISILRHFEVRLTRNVARSRAATGKHGGGRRAQASQFQKIPPGKFFSHAFILSPG